MRLVSLSVALAFLLTAMHVLIDHRGGGYTSFVFLPHVNAAHCHGDTQCSAGHHDHDDAAEPLHGPNPHHHDTETHSHFTWYTAPGAKIAPPFALGVLAAGMAAPSITGLSPLYGRTPTPPPRRLSLYLQCSILRI